MKRTLVLTHEEARHPFRRSLPRHVFAGAAERPAIPTGPSAPDDQDWKLFLLSFAAFFTVAYTFIAGLVERGDRPGGHVGTIDRNPG